MATWGLAWTNAPQPSTKVDGVDSESLINLTKATGDVNPLTSLEATRQLRAELEQRETMLVRRARNQGATWEQIAAALGVTKQAVHKKYGGRGLLYREK